MDERLAFDTKLVEGEEARIVDEEAELTSAVRSDVANAIRHDEA
jgi:hypothetical protein